MSILASSFSVIASSAGVAIVSFFLVRHTHRYLARQRREQGDALPDRNAPCEQGQGARAEVLSADAARYQVQLHEMSREVMGELDTKMRALQVLMRLADESTARLDAAIRRAEPPATCKPSDQPATDDT